MKRYLAILLIATLLIISSCNGRNHVVDNDNDNVKPEEQPEKPKPAENTEKLAANPPKITSEILSLLTEDLKENLEKRNIKTVAIFDFDAKYTVPKTWVGNEVKKHSGVYIDELGKAVVNSLRKFIINKTSSTETDREHLDEIMKELGKNLDSKFDATADRLGQLKIADAFIYIKIEATFKDEGYTGNPAETMNYKHKLVAGYTITAKMVDVSTREVFWIGEIPSWGYECYIINNGK